MPGLGLEVCAGGSCLAGLLAFPSMRARARRRQPRRQLNDPAENSNEVLVRRTIAVSQAAERRGNHPFGALLYDRRKQRIVAEAENTVETEEDITAHAELNLVRFAGQAGIDMRGLTLVTSTEPCPMCSGAIYWAGIREVVYSCSERRLNHITLSVDADGPAMQLPCSEIFSRGLGRGTCLVGQLLEEESAAVHAGFWPKFLARKRSQARA